MFSYGVVNTRLERGMVIIYFMGQVLRSGVCYISRVMPMGQGNRQREWPTYRD